MAQLQHVFRGEIFVGDFKVEIGMQRAKIRACTQPHQSYARRELLLEPADRLACIRRSTWRSILVVHVENQGGSVVGMDQTRQDHPCQEGLTRTGCAENARRTLHELFEVQADRVPLLARFTNSEDGFTVFRAEDLGDISSIGQFDRRVVVGHGLDCDGFRVFRSVLQPGGILRGGWVRTTVEHQGGHDCQVGVERVLVEVLPQARAKAFAVELAGVVGVNRRQLQICHQPVKTPRAAIHHHERAFLHGLRRHSQLHLQVGLKATPSHKANGRVVIAEICSLFHLRHSSSDSASNTWVRRG